MSETIEFSTVKDEPKKITFFNQDGSPIQCNVKMIPKPLKNDYVAVNDSQCFAKSEVWTDRDNVDYELLYIKRCKVGHNSGRLANPFSSMINPREFAAVDTHSGRGYYEYVNVKPDVFNSYISFLKSRNPAHLNVAERELFNA